MAAKADHRTKRSNWCTLRSDTTRELYTKAKPTVINPAGNVKISIVSSRTVLAAFCSSEADKLKMYCAKSRQTTITANQATPATCMTFGEAPYDIATANAVRRAMRSRAKAKFARHGSPANEPATEKPTATATTALRASTEKTREIRNQICFVSLFSIILRQPYIFYPLHCWVHLA